MFDVIGMFLTVLLYIGCMASGWLVLELIGNYYTELSRKALKSNIVEPMQVVVESETIVPVPKDCLKYKKTTNKKEKELPYRKLGYIGHYGVGFFDAGYNKLLQKANLLVDEYNSRINTFPTKQANDNFARKIMTKIDKLLN